MRTAAMAVLALLMGTRLAMAAPAWRQSKKAKTAVFTGEIWDETCAKRGSHDSMAKEAGVRGGPTMSRECTQECHTMGSPLALYDPESKHMYRLDDSKEAIEFAGQKVKVTGILNKDGNKIHVVSIVRGE